MSWTIHTYLRRPGSVTSSAEHVKEGKSSLAFAARTGDDIQCLQPVMIKPHTRYRLSGWIKTENVLITQAGGKNGACLSIDGVGQAGQYWAAQIGRKWSLVFILANAAWSASVHDWGTTVARAWEPLGSTIWNWKS